MITYNHAEYIEEAIKGVLRQKCNFDIELVISNDASLDRTDDVIRRVIENNKSNVKIRYFNQALNLGMNSNFLFCVSKCEGKYIATCEGDDYWIDQNKLQKQIDILENNEEYGLVFTNYSEHRMKKIVKINSYFPKSGDVFLSLLKHEFHIATLTVVVRSKMLKESLWILEDYAIPRVWKMGDYPLWLELSLRTKFYYLDEVTSHYRITDGSSSNSKELESKLEFLNSVFDIKKYFIERQNLTDKYKNKFDAQHLRMSLELAYLFNNKRISKNLYTNKKTFNYYNWLLYKGSSNKLFYLIAKAYKKIFFKNEH